jgi:hypothetical protein
LSARFSFSVFSDGFFALPFVGAFCCAMVLGLGIKV